MSEISQRKPVAWAEINWAGRRVSIEYRWLGPQGRAAPLMVFLHEGLGSVSMWRDFPSQLCQTLGCRGLVYSRPGYGQSTPRPAQERWSPDFMHRQALEVLPTFLDAVGVSQPVWLFGHSDGGSIALIYAARHSSPKALGSYGNAPSASLVGAQPSGQSIVPRAPPVAGTIVMAPHILVEDQSIRSIEQARQAYINTDLPDRLARHHADPDSAFWGWNDIWLNPAFRSWSLEEEMVSIACPLLAAQGLDDEYGTLEQIRGIRHRVPQAELLELADCGHWPHRDQPARLITQVHAFFRRHATAKDETP